MPTRKPQEDWIEAIRVFIKDTLGNKNWQIIENKGKARLGIRFNDGTRTYKYLPYQWKEPYVLSLSLSNSKVLLTTLLS